MSSPDPDSNRSVESIIDRIDVGVVGVDDERTIQYANATVEELLGYPPAELVDQPVTSLTGAGDETGADDGFDDLLETAIAAPNGSEQIVRARHRDGHERRLLASVNEGDGAPLEYVLTLACVPKDAALASQIDGLQDLLRELPTCETRDEICERTVDVAQTMLSHSVVAIELSDDEDGRLEPCAVTPEVDELTTAGRLFPADRSLPWEAFAAQDDIVVDDLQDRDGIDDSTTPLRSAICLPIGTHGVFVAGSTTPNVVSETDVTLANIVAASAYSALERLDRDRALEERTDQLEDQTESIDRLRRLNTVIRDLTTGLTNADTREEITDEVCSRLAAADPYQFAWFGTYDPTSEAVSPETAAGNGDTSLEDLAVTVTEADSIHEPVDRAVHDRTPQADNAIHRDPPFEPWRDAAVRHGYRSTVAVPVVYQDTIYGVFSLYATEQGVFDQLELSVLGELGEMIGYALNVEERKQAFTSDQSVELEFVVHDREGSLFALPTAVAGRFELENLVERRDGGATLFFCNEGGDADEILAWVSSRSSITDVRLLTDRDDECLFECELAASTVWSQLLQRGAMVPEATATTDSARLVIRIPRRADPRSFDELLSDRLGTVELVARREYDEPILTPEEFEAEYRDKLTERQEEVLKTAYYAGYFEWPRETQSGELADILGIAQPTVSRHLRSSEQEFLSTIFEDET